MLQAQRYVHTQGWRPILGHVVSAGEERTLKQCLATDAQSQVTSAAITFVDALQGLESSFYSWATVKLYYSVFYSLRSLLASSDLSIVYEGSKPRRLEAKGGSVCVGLKGTTHQAVIAMFTAEMPSHWLLSQEIALERPTKWLMGLREEANYTRAHFWEPHCPPHFRSVRSAGIRRAINAYLADLNHAFDPDHAAVAYALQALLQARRRVASLLEEDSNFLRPRLSDRTGPLPDLLLHVLGNT